MKKWIVMTGVCLLLLVIQLSSSAQVQSPVKPVTQTTSVKKEAVKPVENKSGVKKVQGKKQKTAHVKPVDKKTYAGTRTLSK